MEPERPSAIASAVLDGWTLVPTPPHVLGVLPGSGIGPEVVGAALAVLDVVAEANGLRFELRPAPNLGPVGPYGPRLNAEVASFFSTTFADGGAVMCGPVSGRFVYDLRSRFSLYCKLVPVRPSSALADVSIVRPERLRGVDVLIVRENAAGLYMGPFGRRDRGRTAYQTLTYTADQVDRVLRVAVRAALLRARRVTVVTKAAGIPEVSALWFERVDHVAGDQPVVVEHLDVDNACFQLVANPQRFDVIVAANLIGDVIGDTAALLLSSRGMSLSANFGDDGRAVYQTAHGAAYDLAQADRCNPCAQILSLAMMLRESFALGDVAAAIEAAVERVLAEGYRTVDIAGPDSVVLGTRALAERIADAAVQVSAGLASGR
jgi:3-isopropylmalate dehydrogenase